ncbi:MAG: hybrid sensor histidine kinase/response regulator [Promethearchaeota archaeon]
MKKFNEEYIEILLDNISDSVFFLDSNGNIIYMNKIAQDLTERTLDSALNKYFSDIFTIKKTKTDFETYDFFTLVLQTKKPHICNKPSILITQTGKEIEVLCNFIPVFDKNNELLGSIITAQDFTEKRNYETALQNALRLNSLGQLSSGIAHDFNNVLTTILGNISLAKMDLNEAGDIFALLNEAEEGIDKARVMTQQLLTFASENKTEKEILETSELLKIFVTFTLSGSNVNCTFNFPKDLMNVEGNRSQLGQVIHNIVVHAVQSMPVGGNIKISARNTNILKENDLELEQGNYVILKIQDNGIGIPESDLSHVFDPFYMSNMTGKDMGLAVVKDIINQHKGNIFIKSIVGEGTTFTIYLPGILLKGSKIKEKKGEIPRKHAKVLVMDDEDIIRRVLSKMLTQLGYEAHVVNEGISAIKLYKKFLEKNDPFDVVILDLTIRGGMGGAETMENLLIIDPKAKVLASSGYTTDKVITNYESFGFSGALIKPYRVNELDKILLDILNK